jgi:succinyl-CoA synthetase alpha subunit
MAVFIDKDTRLVVQGITGRDGSFHTHQMVEYGTSVVAGVTPGKGGQTFESDGRGVPIFNTVERAVRDVGANTAVIYVPPAFAAGAIMEAADAGISLIVAITEGIPVQAMARAYAFVKDCGGRLLGPNCPGLISPGKSKVGIIPAQITTPGPVGVVSRSGTLTYEAVNQLTLAGIGQETEAIVMIGEIGGTDEQEAAKWVGDHLSIPVVGFIAGRTAPPGRRMGHAGAIISGSTGTAEEKIRAFEEHGIAVANRPVEIRDLIKEALGS